MIVTQAWQERWDTDPVFRRRDFQEQIDVCSRLQIKSQHECILRVLQISLSDGLLVALPFSLSSSDSFLVISAWISLVCVD